MRHLGQSCPHPSYGRMLGSDVVGDLVTALVTVLGAGGGALVGAAMALSPEARRRSAVAGAVVGGGVGFLGSLYPNLAARRAVLRSAGCPEAGLGSLLVYSLTKYGMAGALALGARAIDPTVAPSLAAAGTFFLAPLAGQAIVRT